MKSKNPAATVDQILAAFTSTGVNVTDTGKCSSVTKKRINVNEAYNALSSFGKVLAVTLSGTGTGTVKSSPAGINCGSTCSYGFANGTVVTLTATASTGSRFMGWSGACTGASSTCIVTMSAAQSVTATFAMQKTLTLTKSGTGTGTVKSSPAGINCGSTCSAAYDLNETVTLTPTPDARSAFAYWTGDCVGASPKCTVTMGADRAVNAVFYPSRTAKKILTTVAKKIAAGTGTITSSDGLITCTGTCARAYFPNAPVTLTAMAGTTSVFTGWSGACTGTDTCRVTMDKAKSVTATFQGPRVLTVRKASVRRGTGIVTSFPSGINCGATCSARFSMGTPVTLTASPDQSSTFTGWAGLCKGTGTCSVTMNANAGVAATFTIRQFTVTASAPGGHGKVGPATQTVAYGGRASISIVPNRGYRVASVTDNGTSQPVTSPYIIKGVTADHAIVVVFAPKS